jgi:hypothetical protein
MADDNITDEQLAELVRRTPEAGPCLHALIGMTGRPHGTGCSTSGAPGDSGSPAG